MSETDRRVIINESISVQGAIASMTQRNLFSGRVRVILEKKSGQKLFTAKEIDASFKRLRSEYLHGMDRFLLRSLHK